MSDWKDVGRVLLGSWPTQVAAWGREGIAAYVAEIGARGLTPDSAIGALRCWQEKWPPNAGELAELARRDPGAPTFDEAWALIVRATKAADHAVFLNVQHPLIASFVARQGWDRLRTLPVEDPDWGEKTRRELREAWDRHVESQDRREVAALASGGELKQLDPLAALQLGCGS